MENIKIKRLLKVLLSLIIIIVSIYFYGRYIEPKRYIVKEYSIVNSNIPSSFYGVKIVQMSDIHYKVTTTKDDLNKIVKTINSLKPDIVIFTGDLFDKNIKYEEKDYSDLKEIFKSINYNIGKYYIEGENDLNIDNIEDIMNYSDFINLNDKYELIYNEGIEPILLIGISSNYNNNHIKDTLDSIYENIKEEYKYSVLVLHESDFINSFDYSKFNLILAGHTLNGQIKIPFIGGIIKDKYSKNYYDEYYDLGNTKMYISSGLGTSKYKFRLLNKPSISLYRLRNK